MSEKSPASRAEQLGSGPAWSADVADGSGSAPRTLRICVTDSARGRPAEGVLALIERLVNGSWQAVARAASGPSGTIAIDEALNPGIYRVELDAESYFAAAGIVPLLPKMLITFRLLEASGHSELRSYVAANSQFSVLVRSDYPTGNRGWHRDSGRIAI